jgi:hypothetical protein
LKGRDAIRMGRHQIGGPQPDAQAQLGSPCMRVPAVTEVCRRHCLHGYVQALVSNLQARS